MNRDNSIERLILSRCSAYHDDGEIMETLGQRYSLTGLQKNYLVLESTNGGLTKKEILKLKRKKKTKGLPPTILAALRESGSNDKKKTNKYDPLKTKNQFKSFIKSNLARQAKAVRRLRAELSKNPKYLEGVEDVTTLSYCTKILKFEDFLEMNRLWNDYISKVMDSIDSVTSATTRLATCEFVGAYVEVTHSSCIDNIGQCGIIIWESQHNFALVAPREDGWKKQVGLLPPIYSPRDRVGGLRLICKKNTRFKVSVECSDDTDSVVEFEIIGDRMMLRSVDRANKKFKTHSVSDIDI